MTVHRGMTEQCLRPMRRRWNAPLNCETETELKPLIRPVPPIERITTRRRIEMPFRHSSGTVSFVENSEVTLARVRWLERPMPA